MPHSVQQHFRASDEECLSHFFWREAAKGVSDHQTKNKPAAIREKIERLREWYEFEENAANFLFEKEFLVQSLFQAVEPIKRAFGRVPRLRLDILQEGSSAQLFVLIGTKDDPSRALKSLSKFDQNWWFNIPTVIHDHLEFTIEYI